MLSLFGVFPWKLASERERERERRMWTNRNKDDGLSRATAVNRHCLPVPFTIGQVSRKREHRRRTIVAFAWPRSRTRFRELNRTQRADSRALPVATKKRVSKVTRRCAAVDRKPMLTGFACQTSFHLRASPSFELLSFLMLFRCTNVETVQKSVLLVTDERRDS
jgi:hypothetical protein